MALVTRPNFNLELFVVQRLNLLKENL